MKLSTRIKKTEEEEEGEILDAEGRAREAEDYREDLRFECRMDEKWFDRQEYRGGKVK